MTATLLFGQPLFGRQWAGDEDWWVEEKTVGRFLGGCRPLGENADDRQETGSPISANRMMLRHQLNRLWTAPMSVTARTAGTSPEFDQRCRVPFWI